jgi:hypothetical protein
MNRDEVIRLVREHEKELRVFGFSALSIFGSVARDEAHEDSDLDFLVDFPDAPTLEQFMGLKFALEQLLGRSVDLLDRKGLKPHWKEAIEEGALFVA